MRLIHRLDVRRPGAETAATTPEMSGLRKVARQPLDVAPHRLELPAEALEQLVVILQHQQLVDQPRDHVRAERKPSRPVALLLALEPGALEERFMGESIRR